MDKPSTFAFLRIGYTLYPEMDSVNFFASVFFTAL